MHGMLLGILKGIRDSLQSSHVNYISFLCSRRGTSLKLSLPTWGYFVLHYAFLVALSSFSPYKRAFTVLFFLYIATESFWQLMCLSVLHGCRQKVVQQLAFVLQQLMQ